MALLIVIVGVASTLLMGYVQCLIGSDQKLLDNYEIEWLGEDSKLRLRHAARIRDRARETKYRLRWRDHLVLLLTPTKLWIITLLSLSAAGIYLLVWTVMHFYHHFW